MVFEEIFSIFIGIFTDYTLRYVALGSAILGVTSGALGCFTVLRKQSLFGDALSHAASCFILVVLVIARVTIPPNQAKTAAPNIKSNESFVPAKRYANPIPGKAA